MEFPKMSENFCPKCNRKISNNKETAKIIMILCKHCGIFWWNRETNDTPQMEPTKCHICSKFVLAPSEYVKRKGSTFMHDKCRAKYISEIFDEPPANRCKKYASCDSPRNYFGIKTGGDCMSDENGYMHCSYNLNRKDI